MNMTTYFEHFDIENTENVLKIAKKYAKDHNIKSVVVASTTGYTAEKAYDILKRAKMNLVMVTHVAGFLEANDQQFPEDLRKKLEKKDVKVLTTAHAFGGLNKLTSSSVGNTITDTLRMFCEGVKVCVEIAAMAADAGLVRTDEDILAIAGTGKGADTVLVIRPAYSRNLFDLKVKEILARPIY